MKPSRASLALGFVFLAISALVSPAVMIALSGVAICGTSLKLSAVAMSLLLATGLPAAAGACLRSWWPLGTLAFSWALWIILVAMIGPQIEWDRASAILGCVALAGLSAWAGNKMAAKQTVNI